MDQNKQNENKINIELPENVADGIYSNLAVISHSNSEFIIDFIRILPGVPNAKVKSRILLTPQHVKRLFKALQDNIGKFESQYGKIIYDEGFEGVPINFGGPTPEA
jgi:hypothetical protein